MLVAADGDLRGAVLGAVNYGRDNDSYATLAGAVAGALRGVEAIPAAWRDTVVAANPELGLLDLGRRLAAVVRARHVRRAAVVAAVDVLVGA